MRAQARSAYQRVAQTKSKACSGGAWRQMQRNRSTQRERGAERKRAVEDYAS